MKQLRHLGCFGFIQGVFIWFQLALTDIRLNLFPASWNRRLLSTEPSGARTYTFREEDVLSCQQKIEQKVSIVRLVASVSLFFNMSCLRRSLVLRRQLGNIGISTILTYGIKKAEQLPDSTDPYRGHAWLVVESPSMLKGLEVDASATPKNFQELSHEGN